MRQRLMTRYLASPQSYRTLAVLPVVLLLMSNISLAQQGGEKTYPGPGDAALALYKAAKAADAKEMNAILGSASGEITHTGDDVADNNLRNEFIRRYDRMHRVVIEPDGTGTLYIGAENWPFPIPLAKNASGAWYFDTEAGKKEILYRRVGTNENDAIQILYTLVDAQREYASEVRMGETGKHYAGKFLSDNGKQNGLYWAGGDSDSPIGPLIAQATTEGYQRQGNNPVPFHGYYYRILTKQGAAAKGGARDYIVNGQLTKGFAFVAWPAQYRNSGVMTFIVNEDGTIYQKDLGPDTAKLAASMAEYNPDKSWSKVD